MRQPYITILLCLIGATGSPAIATTIATIQIDETASESPPGNHLVAFTVTNDTGVTVEWFAVQTGNPMDWSSSPDGWTFDLVSHHSESRWDTANINCEFCPAPAPTEPRPSLSSTWQGVTGMPFDVFMTTGGFDPTLGLIIAIPVLVDPFNPLFLPSAGIADGAVLGGFVVQGLPGSQFLASLSDGSTVSGPLNEPISVGPGGTAPEPATLSLLALGIAAIASRRRDR